MISVMDATEAQLRFGASLTNTTDPSHPLHPLHTVTQPAPPSSSGLGGINVLGSSQARSRTLGESSSVPSSNARVVSFPNTDTQRTFERDCKCF